MSQPHPDPIHFQEKSAWAVLISTFLIYGAYFVVIVITMSATEERAPDNLFYLLIGAIIAQIIALTASHILFAVRAAPESKDERDHVIELKSDRIGGWVLGTGVMLVILTLVAGGTFGAEADSALRLPGSFVTGNLLLMVFVLSEIVKRVSQVIYYRKGV